MIDSQQYTSVCVSLCLCVFVCLHLSVCLTICRFLSVCTTVVVCLSTCLFIYRCVCLCVSVYLSTCLFVYRLTYMYLWVVDCLFPSSRLSLSVFLSVVTCPSKSLSVCRCLPVPLSVVVCPPFVSRSFSSHARVGLRHILLSRLTTIQ